MPISFKIIQSKALSIFNTLKSCEGEVCTETFTGKNCMFWSFCWRFRLHICSIQGEAVSAGVEAAEKFIGVLDKIIEEGGYCPKQIFIVQDRTIMGKMPKRMYLNKQAISMPGFKAFLDRVTLLLGGNVAWHELKKIFVCQSQNSHALKNVNKHTLPVFYWANSKAWMTQALFEDWFINCFIPA